MISGPAGGRGTACGCWNSARNRSPDVTIRALCGCVSALPVSALSIPAFPSTRSITFLTFSMTTKGIASFWKAVRPAAPFKKDQEQIGGRGGRPGFCAAGRAARRQKNRIRADPRELGGGIPPPGDRRLSNILMDFDDFGAGRRARNSVWLLEFRTESLP